MTIDEILEEMESLLVDASRVPFTNKRVIEEDDLARFLDELREELPKELNEAKQIISERQRILDDAQKEAQNIVDQAKNYVLKLTDENAITQQAQEYANDIVGEAQKSARELKNDSVAYAADVLKWLEGNLEKTLEAVRANSNELSQQNQNRKIS